MKMSLVQAHGGPLCPMSGLYQNDAHRLYNRVRDATYKAFKPLQDDDGELPEDVDAAMGRLLDDINESMRLYTVSGGGVPPAGARRIVEARGAYWQCLVCGLVLPASHVDARKGDQ